MCEPVDKVISQLPPQSVYEQYGRSSKLLIHPKDVPEIPLELFTGQRHHEELEKLETDISMMVDTGEESKNRKGTYNDGNVQQEDSTESLDWKGNLHRANDTLDESKNCEGCCNKASEQSRKDSCVIKRIGNKFTTRDTLDKSRNREQYCVREEVKTEECDVNMLTIDLTKTAIDSSDESRNRPNVPKLDREAGKTISCVKGETVRTHGDIDTNDRSRNRTYKPTLAVIYDSTQKPLKTRNDIADVAEQGKVEKLWTSSSMKSELSDELRSRQDRCSMSTYKQMQQPVTPVLESGCIEPTRVNIHDIDECLVTNKCECSKQDSKHMSKQWLSNTFSIFTSSAWGKSKSKTGEEITENVNTNRKTNHIFKPEFNFFL